MTPQTGWNSSKANVAPIASSTMLKDRTKKLRWSVRRNKNVRAISADPQIRISPKLWNFPTPKIRILNVCGWKFQIWKRWMTFEVTRKRPRFELKEGPILVNLLRWFRLTWLWLLSRNGLQTTPQSVTLENFPMISTPKCSPKTQAWSQGWLVWIPGQVLTSVLRKWPKEVKGYRGKSCPQTSLIEENWKIEIIFHMSIKLGFPAFPKNKTQQNWPGAICKVNRSCRLFEKWSVERQEIEICTDVRNFFCRFLGWKMVTKRWKFERKSTDNSIMAWRHMIRNLIGWPRTLLPATPRQPMRVKYLYRRIPKLISTMGHAETAWKIPRSVLRNLVNVDGIFQTKLLTPFCVILTNWLY